jgi:hypothetical protein
MAAREAGLLRLDGSYGQDVPIADSPTTTITVEAGGERHVVSVYALHDAGTDPDYVPGGEGDLRRALLDFTRNLSDLERWLPEGSVSPEEEFSLDRLRVVSHRYDEPDFILQPEPGMEQPERDWPLPGDLASFGEPVAGFSFAEVRCAAVEGSDLQTLLAAARQASELTPWVSGGQRFGVVFRPLLPDEPPCPEG